MQAVSCKLIPAHIYLTLNHCLQPNTVLIFHFTAYFNHVLFCPEEGNKFPKTLDLYIKVLVKCKESAFHLMVLTLSTLNTL